MICESAARSSRSPTCVGTLGRDDAQLANTSVLQELGVTASAATRAGGAARTRRRLDVAPSDEPSTAARRRRRGRARVTIARSAEEALAAIRADIGDCTRCKLHTLGRKQIVFGVGNPDADLMFVGEAPGADEDVQGIPFVGRAGQLLTKIIEAIGLKRDDVYIANVIKCRPPGTAIRSRTKSRTCEPFLFRQIDASSRR